MGMEVYYVLLGIAAIITSITGSRNSKALGVAIAELKAELADHRSRIQALEKAL